MTQPISTANAPPGPAIVVGAGIGGLAAALRLAHAGHAVTVIERHDEVGGKMRTLPSAAGPVDAGPTVMTLRPVFEELFADVGERLDDHLDLHPQPLLARHWWSDGSTLDLTGDVDRDARAVEAFAGAREARAFARFSAQAQRLFEAFDAPMMRAPAPDTRALTAHVLRNPGLIGPMLPGVSLAGKLALMFRDARLRQLFGRYATYVGGTPTGVPALLSLIWHAEAAGVWHVAGGMHRLAQALAGLITARGGTIMLGAEVQRIAVQDGRITGVHLADDTRLATDLVVFNGDPRALATGLLGTAAAGAVDAGACEPRALSANVWAFAACVRGAAGGPPVPELVHHNVFFGHDPKAEFADLAAGRMPGDATLYICAQDRGGGAPPAQGPERFEIILNAPPLAGTAPPTRAATEKEKARCQTQAFRRLTDFGLSFDPLPGPETLTTPPEWEALFPASGGSLYGPSPHGMMAGLRKPQARTSLPGLYLVGGGVHPGAGIPMATLSARHAAAAITADRSLTSTCRPTAMHGGMSTASRTMGGTPSRSSAS